MANRFIGNVHGNITVEAPSYIDVIAKNEQLELNKCFFFNLPQTKATDLAYIQLIIDATFLSFTKSITLNAHCKQTRALCLPVGG